MINEACQVWIEQRIKEELPTGKSYRAIGREIAQEITRVFESKVNPRTIEKRAERVATNVAPTTTPEPPNQNQEKPQEEKRDESGKFQDGTKPGPGRPSKYEQESEPLFNLKRWWKRATKKDRKVFLTWIQEER